MLDARVEIGNAWIRTQRGRATGKGLSGRARLHAYGDSETSRWVVLCSGLQSVESVWTVSYEFKQRESRDTPDNGGTWYMGQAMEVER